MSDLEQTNNLAHDRTSGAAMMILARNVLPLIEADGSRWIHKNTIQNLKTDGNARSTLSQKVRLEQKQQGKDESKKSEKEGIQ